MESLTVAIAGVVAGDLACLADVRDASHPALLEAAAKLPPLVVSRATLAKVLESMRAGSSSLEDIQSWASFVRRGYVSGKIFGGVRPVQIEYQPNDDSLIVEIIGRLDEIGDKIDGVVDPHELEEMRRALRE